MKRLICMILAMALCMGLFAMTASAETVQLWTGLPEEGKTISSHDAVELAAAGQQYYVRREGKLLLPSSGSVKGADKLDDVTPVYIYTLPEQAYTVMVNLPFDAYVIGYDKPTGKLLYTDAKIGPAASCGVVLGTQTEAYQSENGAYKFAAACEWSDLCLSVEKAGEDGTAAELSFVVEFRGGAKSGLPLFRDVKAQDWFCGISEKAAELGIVRVPFNRQFRPNAPVTRAEFLTMIWRMAGEPKLTDDPYFYEFFLAGKGTIPNWATFAVTDALWDGLVDGDLRANDVLTREEMADILYRYAVLTGDNAVEGGMGLKERDDYGEISETAMAGMEWAFYNGILQGADNTVMPKAAATRAQAAAVLVRFAEKYAK